MSVFRVYVYVYTIYIQAFPNDFLRLVCRHKVGFFQERSVCVRMLQCMLQCVLQCVLQCAAVYCERIQSIPQDTTSSCL